MQGWLKFTLCMLGNFACFFCVVDKISFKLSFEKKYRRNIRGPKFHSSVRNYEWNLERTSNSSQSTRPVTRVYRTSALGKITCGSRITYNSHMFFIVYAFKGHVHAFAGRVKVVSHLSCRTSAIFKYFCPLNIISDYQTVWIQIGPDILWAWSGSKQFSKFEVATSRDITPRKQNLLNCLHDRFSGT